MDLKEVYARFERIGACSFTTLNDEGVPTSRIAHLFAGDEEGLYLRCMDVKPFYRQLKRNEWLSICGDCSKGVLGHDEHGVPLYAGGFTMRVVGKVRELTMEEVEAKAQVNDDFGLAVYDIGKYPRMRVFVMYRGSGELYDYDFEMYHRDHKLYRERFAFGGDTFVEPGLVIGGECISCNACFENCTFKAIVPGEDGAPYRIRGERCDECGSCYNVCPVGAVHIRGVDA